MNLVNKYVFILCISEIKSKQELLWFNRLFFGCTLTSVLNGPRPFPFLGFLYGHPRLIWSWFTLYRPPPVCVFRVFVRPSPTNIPTPFNTDVRVFLCPSIFAKKDITISHSVGGERSFIYSLQNIGCAKCIIDTMWCLVFTWSCHVTLYIFVIIWQAC